LPVHIGVAGPAKLQTLIKFAIACGVGPSLQGAAEARDGCHQAADCPSSRRSAGDLAAHKAAHPDFEYRAQVHFFPLGGIKANRRMGDGRTAGRPAPRRLA
jgi:methylenetetrahydrofolate reductase (NADPH)